MLEERAERTTSGKCGQPDLLDIAFVADNPGDWMLHCHILEHQSGGMMSVVRVA